MIRTFSARTLVLAISFFVVGCATHPPGIEHVNLKFDSLRPLVVSSLPVGVTKQSANLRRFTTKYFDPTNINKEPVNNQPRGFAIVTILGSTRPYNIEVEGFRETKGADGNWLKTEDRDLAQEVIKRIMATLANRREDLNFVDDFRAY